MLSTSEKTSQLKTYFPLIYESLFSKKILNQQVVETKATCSLCSKSPERTRDAVSYREDLKCCTFYPFMPNFLVGAILAQSGPEDYGRQQVESLIRKRRYALPVGLVAPIRYQLAFNARRDGEFGNREDWLCPYFHPQKKNCSIWQSRSAVCTSFYCQSNSGVRGLDFWHEVSEYLTYVEMALLEEFLVYHDFSPRQISDQLDYLNRQTGTQQEQKSWALPEAKSRKLWNGYFEDQIGFYIKSYEFVLKMTPDSFHELLGGLGKDLEKKVISAYQKTNYLKHKK